ALRVVGAPALDGTLDGFETSSPITLDSELQYRRSEEPYEPERISAEAWVNWDADAGALFVAVEVGKPELIFRPADAPPLELDNDPDGIRSDGLQVYWARDGAAAGVLAVPQEGGGVHARRIPMSSEEGAGKAVGEDAGPAAAGRWARTGS